MLESVVLGRPVVTDLPMDPYERQWADLNRQYAEPKAWVLTPMLGLAMQHLNSFKAFPIRQVDLSADVGKTIEGVQSQVRKLQQRR